MKTFPCLMLPAAAWLLATSCLPAADAPAPASAAELAAKMSALQQDGSSLVRLKLDGPKGTVQLQIKQRRSPGVTDVVYQVLWPKERQGEGVLLRKSGSGSPTGAVLAGGSERTLDAAQMKEPLLGSDLAYADVVENFFDWDQQTIVGTEVVDRVSCQILESRPGKGERSIYSVVRSWIDVRRMVPLRVEKYTGGGQPARRITTTRVVTDDMGRHIPANLTVQNLQNGSTTELDGSKLKHGVTFTDQEFTLEGLKVAPK